MRGKPTLRTIAEAAGVHTSTVSRALNPAESNKVSDETVARIRSLAKEYGFEPNPWARSLRTHRTHMIGLIIPRLVDGVLAIMFEAAEDRARQLGYQAITTSTHDRENEEERLINVLLDRRVDGLILSTAPEHDPILDELDAGDVPFVLMNRASGPHPCVRGDDEEGGFLAADHLLSQGHRRVGMLAGPDGVSTSALRCAGYRRAHREHGLEVDEELVVRTSLQAESGLKAATELLELPHPPTALVAINDAVAMGAMAAARDQGLTIPDDLAVVGYNDSPVSTLLPVQLSSVAVPLEDIGIRAVELLMERIAGRTVESVILPPVLRERASSQRRPLTAG